jgi:murein DD-endopeptidase MepM/ murein hydrolase activator NlpD
MQDSSLISPLSQVPTEVLTSPGSRLESRVHAAQNASGEIKKDELKKVSQEFEAIFIAQLLKVMRETIEESGLWEGGFGKSIYTELFDQEVSLSMAQRGALGMSDLLYRSLATTKNSNEGKSTASPAENPPSPPPTPSPSSREDSKVSDGPHEEVSDLQLPVWAPVSSAFGLRKDPFSHQTRFHKGLDFAAPEGMRVVAALPGTVVFAGYQNGYGNTVLMQHAGGIQTRYGHLGSISVKAGDVIGSESILGTVGDTGRSTGPHLHFEVIRMGRPVDPLLSFNSETTASGSHPGNSKMGI